MAHLLRLELKKIRLRNYIFIVLAAILFGMFFITVALHDSSESAHTFPEAFRVVEMIFAFVFVIFSPCSIPRSSSVNITIRPY